MNQKATKFTIEPSNIKIEQLDNQVKDSESPYPKGKGYYIWCIIGKRGSGKSTIILSMLENHLKQYYDNIYMISTTADKDKKFKKLIEELDEEDKFYKTLNNEVIEDIMNKLEENIDDNERRNLLILDDVIHLIPNSTDKDSLFNRLIVGSRHYKVDIWITSQKLNKLNTLIRNNLDMISLFPTHNKHELDCYTSELNVNKKEFEEMLKFVEDSNDHSFLHITFIGNKARFFKNFDRIIKSSQSSSDNE